MNPNSKMSFAVLLLLFFVVTAPPTTAEFPSKTPGPSPSPSASPFTKTFSLSSISFANFDLQLSLVYLSSLVYWISVCFKVKQSHRRVYFLMGSLILLKAVTLIFKSSEEVTGTHGSDIPFFIYQFLGILHLSVVLKLIVSGWAFAVPFMQQVDKIALSILIPLRIYANMAETIMGETSDWENMNDMLTVIGFSTCYVMVLLPLFASMRSMATDIGMDTPMKDQKFIWVRWFYSIVMVKLVFMGFMKLARNNSPSAIDADSDFLRGNHVALELYNIMFYVAIFDFFKKHFADFVDQDEVGDLELSKALLS